MLEELEMISEEERKSQPLFIKLESAIQQTLKRAMSYKHRMKLILPSATLFNKDN
jgi:hypothetical protein